MRRLLKSKKALSPVVATIFFIAVIVVVSVVIAFWLGGLTFSFMRPEHTKSITISIPERFNATHVEYKAVGNGKEYAYSSEIVALPQNFTVNVSLVGAQVVKMELRVSYYKQISLNVFECLGEEIFLIFCEETSV